MINRFNYFLIIFVLAHLSCKSREAVLLRLNYHKGDQQKFTIKFKADCSTSMYVNSELEAILSVDSVIKNDDEYCISSKITGVKTAIKMPDFLSDGVEQSYDSKKEYSAMTDHEREIDKQYEAVINPYYDISLNRRGEIIKPFSLYRKKIDPPFAIGLVQLPYPDQKVKVGYSWSSKIINPLFHTNGQTNIFSSTFKLIYKIEDITANEVFIQVKLSINADRRVNRIINNLNGEGQYIINRLNGRLLSGHIEVPFSNCDNAVFIILGEEVE